MRIRRLLLLVLAVWALLAPTALAQPPDPDSKELPVLRALRPPEEPAFAPGQLLVKFEEGATLAAEDAALAALGISHVRAVGATGARLLRVPQGQEEEIARQLAARTDVAYAHPNWIVYALDTVPNDPYYSLFQWNLPLIRLPTAWQITTGGPVVIAVLDTGVSLTHPDLQGKLVPGYNAINPGGTPADDHGHGTHVAGIAAAATNNGIGIAGVSWGARIMPVKVLNHEGRGTLENIIDGVAWAGANGAKIVNMSFGGVGVGWNALQDEIESAHAQGIVLVAAMGNDGNSTVRYPAALNHVIAVAATGPTDLRANYSNYGPHCSLAAPGGDVSLQGNTHDMVHSTYGTTYAWSEGTSMATPHVAGAAALLMSLEPMLAPGLRVSPALVKVLLQAGALDLGPPGHDDEYGAGRLDVARSMEIALELEPQLYLPSVARNW